MHLSWASLWLSFCLALSVRGLAKYDQYIYAPASKAILPKAVYQQSGPVSRADALLASAPNDSLPLLISGGGVVTYDFGVNIAGWLHLHVPNTSLAQNLSVTFTESSMWISPNASDSTGIRNAFYFNVTEPGDYVVPDEFQRGGFRYLTLASSTVGTMQISHLQVNYSAVPHLDDLRDYPGYFHSDDELLNRVWYAGAYTGQLCTVSSTQGDSLIIPAFGFPYLNATISKGASTVVDGAKRDRIVYSGDMAIAGPSIAVSTYDLISVQTGIDSLFDNQTADGKLPYSGYPLNSQLPFSFTYHMYGLIDVYDLYLWSGDMNWLQGKWDAWKLGMKYILGTVDPSVGLMNVTSSADWLRFFLGGFNIEANSILYHALDRGIQLANFVGDDSVLSDYQSNRTTIKAAVNSLLWDETDGMFNDNTTTTLHPQDGNVWAVISGITDNSTQVERILENLQARWTPFGPTSVEAGDAVSPFISGFELQAHLLSNRSQSAIDLMRFMWGSFMLDDPRMTNSTFIEGYSADGRLHYPPYADDAYISYAHGWATGPTQALTLYVAGIQVTGPAGLNWTVAPHPGNLTTIDAGFQTTLGTFSVTWNVTQSGTKAQAFNMTLSTPPDTSGTIAIPTFNQTVSFQISASDGSTVHIGENGFNETDYVGVRGIGGGEYSVSAQYSGNDSGMPQTGFKNIQGVSR